MFVVWLSYLFEKRDGHAQVQTSISIPVNRISFDNNHQEGLFCQRDISHRNESGMYKDMR